MFEIEAVSAAAKVAYVDRGALWVHVQWCPRCRLNGSRNCRRDWILRRPLSPSCRYIHGCED